VQWQVSTDNGANFTNLGGETNTTLTFTTSASQNGYQYRAVFTNNKGTVPTTAAILTIDLTPPTFTSVTGTTLTLGCNPSSGDINAALGTATATDAVSTPTVSANDGSVSSTVCSVHKQEHLPQEMYVVIHQPRQEQ
jgi:hypothetical protein